MCPGSGTPGAPAGPPGGGSGCIAVSQIIEIKNKGKSILDKLESGDYIKNANGEWDLVYYISEHEPIFNILNIYFDNMIVKLTPEHLIQKNNKLIQADLIRVGDIINGYKVKEIRITREKVRNPITISGTMRFGDINISCWSYSEKHANKMQKIVDCFDFIKLTGEIGSKLVNELAHEMYTKFANQTFRQERRTPKPPYSPISPGWSPMERTMG